MRKIIFEYKGQAINYYNKVCANRHNNIKLVVMHNEKDYYVVEMYYKDR